MIKDEEISALGIMEVRDKDDDGNYYRKSVSYLKDSIRITITTALKLGSCSKAAYFIYFAIVNRLNKYDYEVKVTRSDIKSATGFSDASISRGIGELIDEKIIELIDKDTYHIPINQCVKGNVNKIIAKQKQLEEELAILEKEKVARAEITEFAIKLRNKKK